MILIVPSNKLVAPYINFWRVQGITLPNWVSEREISANMGAGEHFQAELQWLPQYSHPGSDLKSMDPHCSTLKPKAIYCYSMIVDEYFFFI